MKNLIKHLLKYNCDEIVSNSFKNVHCRGLHSIVFLLNPFKTIRLFIAEPICETSFNHPALIEANESKMSIAFHPHRSNLTLHCVKGFMINWEVERKINGRIKCDKYLYKSKILQGECAFVLQEKTVTLETVKRTNLVSGDSISMSSKALHTVYSGNEWTAWFVYEGGEDISYNSICYSNRDLLNENFDHLYQKMNYEEIIQLLGMVDII